MIPSDLPGNPTSSKIKDSKHAQSLDAGKKGIKATLSKQNSKVPGKAPASKVSDANEGDEGSEAVRVPIVPGLSEYRCAPTTLTYWHDTYQFQDEAIVQHVECGLECEGKLPGMVVLDRTIFYPRGGGQPSDKSPMLISVYLHLWRCNWISVMCRGFMYVGTSRFDVVQVTRAPGGWVEHRGWFINNDGKNASALFQPGDSVQLSVDGALCRHNPKNPNIFIR